MGWFRKREVPAPGPDYAHVDSIHKVHELVKRGELVSLLLLPEAFGGEPISENTIHVPPFAAQLKQETDQNVIVPLALEGQVTRYLAEPHYAGNSFVPIAIKIAASGPSSFNYDLAIWGEALTREPPASFFE